MEEETRIITRVGNYSTAQASPEDCKRCHNAKYGTVIINDLCLNCRDQKVIEKGILEKVERMAEESLSPDGWNYLEIAFDEIKKNRHIKAV